VAASSRAINDDPSIRHLYNALEAAKALGWEETSASIMEDIGFELFRGGRAEEAISILMEALTLSQRCGSKRLEGSVHAQLGNIHLSRGNLQIAIGDLEDALAIRRTLPDLGAVARTLGDLGIAHARSGNREAAVEELSSAAKIYAAIGDQAMEEHLQALSSRAERGDPLINPGMRPDPNPGELSVGGFQPCS
jgi:tetratricopeptide (TPR) repeat protein